MKKIVVFGAGKSSSALIGYLTRQCQENNWLLTVADFNEANAQKAVENSSHSLAVGVNVNNEAEREPLISEADIVISLLPAELHFLVAQSCIKFSKNLLTASYLDDNIKSLRKEIEDKGLLFIGEMGLDPGIDHMSAMRMIHDIHAEGGEINTFYSHCGGLVAPESDNNPWHYKISWNPRNVVNAGKAGATYLKDGKIVTEKYFDLFDPTRIVEVNKQMRYAWYPNRNSLNYIDLYGLAGVKNFMRTTLRHPDFNLGWKNLIDLGLTAEIGEYQTDGMSLREFFLQHFRENDFAGWLEELTGKMEKTKELLEMLSGVIEMESELKDPIQEIMLVDSSGQLKDLRVDEIKRNATHAAALQMNEARTVLKQLIWLGMIDDQTKINRGTCNAAQVLLFILEEKLKMNPNDKDLVVMLHQVEFEKDGINMAVDSSLVVYGEDSKNTAMAKTVGLPLAIAATLILKGELALTGLHIPIIPEIYSPVLKELEKNDIVFEERIRNISN